MQRLLDIIRFSIISPEFVILLLVIMLNYYFPFLFEFIGSKFKSDDEVWKYIPVLPMLFCGLTFKLSSKLITPLENSSNKPLYEWGAFHKINDRVIASYLICILCCIAAFAIWLLANELESNILGCILIGAISISGLTAFQVFLAAQKIRQVVELYT